MVTRRGTRKINITGAKKKPRIVNNCNNSRSYTKSRSISTVRIRRATKEPRRLLWQVLEGKNEKHQQMRNAKT